MPPSLRAVPVLLAALLLGAVMVPSASADDAEQSPAPVPSATPEPTGGPVTPVPDPTLPVTPGPSGPSGPRPPGLPSSVPSSTLPPDPSLSPAPAPSSTGAPVPVPGTDGVLPSYGTDDDYWEVFRLLEDRQRAVDAAQGQVAATVATLASETAQRDALVSSWGASESAAVRSRLVVDRLAVRLYQAGTPQLSTSVVSAMLGAPEDFLARVDTSQSAQVAVSGAVDRAAADGVRAALERTRAGSADARVQAAAQAVVVARAGLVAARRELAGTASELDGLAGGAPQTVVGPDGCPRGDVAGTLRGGAQAVGARRLCRAAVAGAATAQAALAITWAFAHLGSAYACGGAGRMLAWRMDCSSLVSRAYHEGAGLATAGQGWAPSTRDMVPWGGVGLDRHYALVSPGRVRPGDLVLYDTGGATYRHVVMYLGPVGAGGVQWMLHTNSCGDVAKVEPFWGFPATGSHTFLVARRVLRLPTDPPAPKAAVAQHGGPHRSPGR